jgi:putative peptidoglycan lipid II flippase
MQDTKTPVKIAVLSLIVNIALNILLIRPMGHGGLALASSISSSLNLILLLWILRDKIGRIDGRKIARSSIKAVAASLVIILLGIIVSHNQVWGLKGSWGYKTMLLGAGMGISIAGYLIIHFFLKTEELTFLIDLIKKRRGR